MIGCQACSSVKRRLSKVCLRNIRDLSMPGSEIPNWFAQEIVFSERKNRELVAVIVGIVYSLDHQMAEDLRPSIPVLPDVQARILKRNKPVFNTTLHLLGVPRSHEDQIYLCRYAHFHPLVSMLKNGCKIEIIKRQPPVIEGFNLKEVWDLYGLR
ncbi:hypothetical protein K2173_022031 [Erythroxylum novogranatense]|uniref:Uncharacterized protein n=1 Tax=Erythroxylum novogranatense TaxID=1862640 RepID=A0AAV8T362_9ROSI|nr:hypothetical protein K2173_022031 [Erythroxylum novogranatense]